MFGRHRAHRTWPQRLVLTATALTGVISLAAAGGLEYAGRKAESIDRIDFEPGLADTPGARSVLADIQESDDPVNFLVVGTDSAVGLDPSDPVGDDREGLGERADVMMVVRLDPVSHTARLLSIPRDLWVEISGAGYQAKINGALGVGVSTLIQTIGDELGIPINHYVQVNFAGFENLVGIVGGIPMWFETPVRDRQTGLLVNQTGCVTLGPVQALAYARSRTLEALIDGDWEFTDQSAPDLSRIGRQQDFVRRAAERAVSQGLRNLIDLNRILNAALGTVLIDSELSVGDLLSLGRTFRSFDTNELETMQLPVVVGRVGRASVVRLIEDEAESVLSLFRPSVAEGDVSPAQIRVRALNGTGRMGEAAAVADGLEIAGFDVVQRDNASSFDHPSVVIRYRPGNEAAAALVGRYFDPEPAYESAPALEGVDVEVITGSSYTEVREQPRPKSDDDVAAGSTGTSAPSTPPEDGSEEASGAGTGASGAPTVTGESAQSATTVPPSGPRQHTGSAC